MNYRRLIATIGIVFGFLFVVGAMALIAHSQTIPRPDPKLTPGAVDATLTKEILCDPSHHTAENRHVTRSEKVASCRAYGIGEGCPGPGYEIDHLISIELGGSNDIKNLWPEPVDVPGKVIGFHAKDVVENRAHAAVCSGKLTLKQAQDGISRDWYKFGLTYGLIGAKQ